MDMIRTVLSFSLAKLLLLTFTLLCITVLRNRVAAQASESIAQDRGRHEKDHLRETIYVHTDKTFYMAGETLWFKIYDVYAGDHQASQISKVAYVELMAADGKPLVQAKVALEEGRGHGSLVLPVTSHSGPCLLRAYTSWMKNFGASFFFQKPITLVNTYQSPNWPALDKPLSFYVRFFPEGGDLVNGLESVVGFEATDAHGKGISCAGAIINDRKDTVARFTTFKFGLGRFRFRPESGARYQVVLYDLPAGQTEAVLPAAQDRGYIMHMERTDPGHISVTVVSNTATNGTVYLMMHSEGGMNKAWQQPLADGKALFTIDTAALPQGLSRWTLFDAERQSRAERLYFTYPHERLQLQIRSDRQQYETRSKVQLQIRTEGTSLPAMQDLSVAVYRVDSLQRVDSSDIYSYLWLCAGLPGRVASPQYYLEKEDGETALAMENLLLIQGWRRFRLEDSLGHRRRFTFLPEYEGSLISGSVHDKRTGAPVPGVLAWLTMPGEHFRLSNAVSDSSGQLHFILKEDYGGGELVLNTARNSDYVLGVQNPFSETSYSWQPPAFVLQAGWKEQLLQHSINGQVQYTFGADTLQTVTLPAQADTALFYQHADNIYYLDDYTRFPTMEEVMREFVKNVRVRKEDGKFHFGVMNIPYQTYFNKDPLLLLDGVPVPEVDQIMAFDPLKVKKIEVVARKYFSENSVNDGIVSFSTYEGDLGGFTLDPSALVVEYQGLQLEREFYHPVYATPEQRMSRLPDNRNVLYWAPDVTTNARGKAEIDFYTSDIPGMYVVEVQGMDTLGRAGSGRVMVEVK
jgi:hypothetical protein